MKIANPRAGCHGVARAQIEPAGPDNRPMVSFVTPPSPVPDPPLDAIEPTGAAVRGLSLRTRIQLLLGALMALFISALLAQQIEATRNGVHEEIVAGNRVAGQLLQRVGFLYRLSGPGALLDFLNQLGRVRANEITLTDPSGAVLYRSPASAYKRGRSAPDWFADWVAPAPQRQLIELPSGQLVVEADPSRAILDGWDDLRQSALAGGLTLLLLNLVVFWSVGRTLRPFSTILRGLARLEGGDYAARLPDLPGREAASIGHAVNRMAAAVEGQLQARLAAYEAQRSLAESRELARQIEHHTERERREMARELHDELGQSVTAIRSLANSLVHRLGERDVDSAEVAALISSEAARLYEAMHGLIPRLTPMALDSLGLADALNDLVSGVRQRPGAPQITLQAEALPDAIDRVAEGDLALAAYRVAQEALNNALRHSQANAIAVDLRLLTGDGGRETRLQVTVEDNGVGLPGDWQRPGHYGLRGLRERVRGLGGELLIEGLAAPQTGVRVRALWPLASTPPSPQPERQP